MTVRTVDLNADVGESFGRWHLGDDEAMLAIVSSANVACGFHAGDPATLRRTCAVAVERGVAIGAQVGYRDLAGFGRRYIDVSHPDLMADVIYQIGALRGIAESVGGTVSFVKPHGALYNTVASAEGQAAAVIDGVVAAGGLSVVGLSGSRFLQWAADAGLDTVSEVFADRSYQPDGTLTPRSQPGSVLDDPSAVAARAVQMVTAGRVEATDGSSFSLVAQSVCLHGDSPDAVSMADAVRAALAVAEVDIASPHPMR